MINKQSRNHTLCTAMKSPGTHLQTSFPHTGMLAQPIRFADCKFRFPIRLQCCYWIACHAIILQVFDMSSGATSWLPLISLPNHTLYTPVEVGHIFCTRDYALEIIVCLHSYLNSSSVIRAWWLILWCFHADNCVGRVEGNNHPASLAVDALSSHFTNLTVLQKRTSFTKKFESLYSASKTLQIGQASSWSTRNVW